jgi:hypothetical protein
MLDSPLLLYHSPRNVHDLRFRSKEVVYGEEADEICRCVD